MAGDDRSYPKQVTKDRTHVTMYQAADMLEQSPSSVYSQYSRYGETGGKYEFEKIGNQVFVIKDSLRNYIDDGDMQ